MIVHDGKLCQAYLPYFNMNHSRVDSEKNESLKFDIFDLAHSLAIQLKCKNVNGLALSAVWYQK